MKKIVIVLCMLVCAFGAVSAFAQDAKVVVIPLNSSAKMAPIAYGNISATGVIDSGSGNFTCSTTPGGRYAITIDGESYHLTSYSTMVTPTRSQPLLSSTSSFEGNLLVYIYNQAGTPVSSRFSFVTYK